MSGLCDVTTGLKEGAGLQFQTPIGTVNLIVQTSAPMPPTSFFLLEDGTSFLLLEDGASKLGLENNDLRSFSSLLEEDGVSFLMQEDGSSKIGLEA